MKNTQKLKNLSINARFICDNKIYAVKKKNNSQITVQQLLVKYEYIIMSPEKVVEANSNGSSNWADRVKARYEA